MALPTLKLNALRGGVKLARLAARFRTPELRLQRFRLSAIRRAQLTAPAIDGPESSPRSQSNQLRRQRPHEAILGWRPWFADPGRPCSPSPVCLAHLTASGFRKRLSSVRLSYRLPNLRRPGLSTLRGGYLLPTLDVQLAIGLGVRRSASFPPRSLPKVCGPQPRRTRRRRRDFKGMAPARDGLACHAPPVRQGQVGLLLHGPSETAVEYDSRLRAAAVNADAYRPGDAAVGQADDPHVTAECVFSDRAVPESRRLVASQSRNPLPAPRTTTPPSSENAITWSRYSICC
jgi:hypothetical protein